MKMVGHEAKSHQIDFPVNMIGLHKTLFSSWCVLFFYLLRKYLEPGFQEKKYTPRGEECLVEPNHVHREVDLVAFCLMPNHFHLLLFQKSLEGMTKLLVRLCSSYSTYFNQKYEKKGSPFQGIYRAVAVTTEEQLLHLSRYIRL